MRCVVKGCSDRGAYLSLPQNSELNMKWREFITREPTPPGCSLTLLEPSENDRVCTSHFKGAMANFLIRESKLIAKIEEEKQEQIKLNEILNKKMQEAQSHSLIEKYQILTEMIHFQKKISRTVRSMETLEKDLQTLQREKEVTEVISEIERVKKEQDILNEVLSTKMHKAKSLPLIEKSQILTEMLSFQDEISKTTEYKKKLEERLDALLKVRANVPDLLKHRLDSDVEISSSVGEEIDALHELGQEIANQLKGEVGVSEVSGVRKVGEGGTTMKRRYHNECAFCHLQFASRSSLNNHWKKFEDKCMTRTFCREDHAHDMIVGKFSTKQEGLGFLNTLAETAPFRDVYTPKNETILTCRCKMDCPAKIPLKAVERQDPLHTVEYVLQACLGHEPAQPPQVLMLVEQGQQL